MDALKAVHPMPVDIDVNRSISDGEQRERIITETRTLLTERDEHWCVKLEALRYLRDWMLTADAPGFHRVQLLANGEKDPAHVSEVLQQCLAEFDRQA